MSKNDFVYGDIDSMNHTYKVINNVNNSRKKEKHVHN